ncbi:MAG: GNAT family N-acetyltransferase [Alphaproteobacteria bacterium]
MPQIFPLPLAGPLPELQPEIDAIFYEAAARKSFADEKARARFHDIWLGRYLRHCPEDCFLALDDDSRVVGYLAGTLISNADPLPGPDYYALFPSGPITTHPAHIHVNVRKEARGNGTGTLLVAAFAHHCMASGVSGFHAVTMANSRSEDFFKNCGMRNLADTTWNGHPIVFLGRRGG